MELGKNLNFIPRLFNKFARNTHREGRQQKRDDYLGASLKELANLLGGYHARTKMLKLMEIPLSSAKRNLNSGRLVRFLRTFAPLVLMKMLKVDGM